MEGEAEEAPEETVNEGPEAEEYISVLSQVDPLNTRIWVEYLE